MDYDAFAKAWQDAWNSHDLTRILSHYYEDIVFRSQKAMQLTGSGELHGKGQLRAYWAHALEKQPNLCFAVRDVFHGHGMMAISYENHAGILAAETLRFGPDGLVVEASACHRPA